MGVTSTREVPFTEDDLYLLQVVADRVAPAIERGRLMETVRAGREPAEDACRAGSSPRRKRNGGAWPSSCTTSSARSLTAVKINLHSLERSPAAPTPDH